MLSVCGKVATDQDNLFDGWFCRLAISPALFTSHTCRIGHTERELHMEGLTSY